MMDLQQIRRDLRARLSVYTPEWPMTVRPSHVLALLDALDAAETQVQRVRELHQPCDNDRNRTPICEHCHGKAGTHLCGCWAPTDRQPVCAVCNEGNKGIRVEWPCTTIRSLDEESDDYPEPACLIHDITGEDVPGWEMAECTCPTIRPHVKVDTPDPRLHVLARRLPDWPTDDLADLLAELDTAVTL